MGIDLGRFLGWWGLTMLLAYPAMAVWLYVSAFLLAKAARRPYGGLDMRRYRWTMLLAIALHALSTAPLAGLLMSLGRHR